MNKFCLVGLAAVLAAPVALADMPKGQVMGHITMTSAEIDGLGPGSDFDDDGTGFGIRGWGTVQGPWFVHGEYQTVGLDDTNLDVDQIRLGGGYAMDTWIVKAEYIDTGSDLDQAGFGVHGGLHGGSDNVGFFGTVGYLTTDDSDGFELNVGGSFAFNRDLSVVVDYRTFLGSLDPDGDLTLSDLRVGLAYSFY